MMNNNIRIDRWNERYRQEAFAYGKMPNEYLKTRLASLTPGKALFPAEGEGRNSVHAAGLGWTVDAFDISEEGRKKALLLAEQQGQHETYLPQLKTARMNFLFWFCWIIDLLILIVCLFETFAVSSNSSLLTPAIVLAILLAGGWWLKSGSPKLALGLVGAPFILLVLYFIVYIIAGNSSNWR